MTTFQQEMLAIRPYHLNVHNAAEFMARRRKIPLSLMRDARPKAGPGETFADCITAEQQKAREKRFRKRMRNLAGGPVDPPATPMTIIDEAVSGEPK